MNMKKNIQFAKESRSDVQITLPDGRLIKGYRGATLETLFSLLKEWENAKITAFHELFPDAFLSVEHSVPNGGYFSNVIGRDPLTKLEVAELEHHMLDLARQDVPITKEKVKLDEAIVYFEGRGYHDKVHLLKYRKKDYLVLYQLNAHRDYHHGYMVPSTGYLDIFRLHHNNDGFILQYPRRATPTRLYQMPKYSKLLDIFKQYGSWLESLDIDSVASLNDSIQNGNIREVILVSEALHEQKIAQIATMISERSDQFKIISIAGPTSSGKTTFSKRLAIQLLTHGISPFALEMDNYFVERDKTPLDEEGKPNFEAFEALDSKLMEYDLSRLLEGNEVTLPRYNFRTGKREVGDRVRIAENQVVVIEGIHGLNPELISDIDRSKKFLIYASCLTQLNLDHYNRISTTDSRLIRRIVRDARTRGYPAMRTIQLWDSVRRGEREYIFPYQENADAIFNSALVYELAALKASAEPLLRQIPHGSEEYLEAKRLLAFLQWFMPVDEQLIPDNSIVREFIGGSILGDFHLWNHSPIEPME